jgi:hypothetical protein
MKQVAIIGNAELQQDYADLVDSSDLVIRFNTPLSWAHKSGRRFDIWVLANGKGGQRFADAQLFRSAPYRDLPDEIWFPRPLALHRSLPLHPMYGGDRVSEGMDIDYGDSILLANNLSQPILRLDTGCYQRCFDRLYPASVANSYVLMPSAGFIVTHYVLEQMPDTHVLLIGFTFQGWPGHPWLLEQENIVAMHQQGRLQLLAC